MIKVGENVKGAGQVLTPSVCVLSPNLTKL